LDHSEGRATYPKEQENKTEADISNEFVGSLFSVISIQSSKVDRKSSLGGAVLSRRNQAQEGKIVTNVTSWREMELDRA
jgi:hypothetical protein